MSTVFLWAVISLLQPDLTQQDVSFHGKSRVRFATPAQARDLLTQNDLFLNSLSRVDRQVRLRSADEVSIEQFKEFVSAQVLAWKQDDRRRMTDVLLAIRAKLAAYEIPFPDRILLISTTGKEEAGAAYCRGAAVILPSTMLRMRQTALERLLLHELFHVLSNQNPALRDRLYRVIHFEPCSTVQLPEDWDRRRLTNPDGPTLNHYVKLNIDGEPTAVVPLLFSKSKQYSEGGLFSILQFRLAVVDEKDGVWQPRITGGQPLLLDPNKTPDYLEKIGRNTSYIIHPDEVLADNFVHLVLETPDLANPEIPKAMARILAKGDD